MEDRTNTNPEELLVAERAAEWLERLKEAGPQERAEFNRWLRESPRNVREILLATTWDSALGNMDPDRRIDVEKLIADASVNVVPVRGSHSQTVHRKGVPSWPRMAGLGFACAAALAFVLVGSGMLDAVLPLTKYSTDIGEQRAIELEDGSLISLNTQSTVRVDLSGQARDIYLDSGQALFVVAHDTDRPFRVHVGSALVQAIGTKFDVWRVKGRTDVAVLEGRVRIDAETERAAGMHERARLAAGQGVSIGADGAVGEPVATDAEQVTAWQQRRLRFKDTTLADVVDEFARYNRTPRIRVEGDGPRSKVITGNFLADDPESLLAFLKTQTDVIVEDYGDQVIIRSRIL